MAVRVFNKERLRPEAPVDQATPKPTPVATKRHHLTREDEADRCLNHTEYSKGAQLMTVLIFLSVVFGVPIAQHVVEIRANLAKRAAWRPDSGEPKPGIAPKIYDVFELLPTKAQIAQAKGFWGYWSLIPSTQSIDAFEKGLKESSVLTQSLLSPAQDVLTGVFGVGNEKAYVGRDGWLFYRNDVDYLTSDGFLSPHQLQVRERNENVQPDPIKAIVDFRDQLAARNISLVVMPMSTKPMIHPEMLVGPSADHDLLQNPSFPEFAKTLEAKGIPVYDPTPLLLRAKASGTKQYLETDTHWTPQAMDAVATDLSAFIRQRAPLPSVANPGYTLKDVPVRKLGDIAEMLKLPKDQQIFRPQSVVTQRVLNSDGSPWVSKDDADVLLLGDSFSNIFSTEDLKWGTEAGFAEHLSYRLGRPVDKIAINGGGALTSRQNLARAMRHSDRLANKHVVVFEFSMRDLAQGDWKLIKLPAPKPTPTPPAPVRPTPPPPVVKLTPITVDKVAPSTIDPTKGQVAQVSLQVPKGKWQAEVQDANGVVVAKLKGGEAASDGAATTKWDGKGIDGKPVAAGGYKVSVSGTRPDGSAVEAVSADVTVIGELVKGEFVSLGAKPDTIDPTAKASTKVAFVAPGAGTYLAEVRDAAGKVVRKLHKQKSTDGKLTFVWDGLVAGGEPAPDGKYKVRVSAEDKASTLKPAEATVTVKAKAKPVPTGNGGQIGTPKGPKPSGDKPAPKTDEGLVVTGTISERSDDPKQDGPYKEALIQIRLTNVHAVSGTIKSGDIGVFVYGMRNAKLIGGAYQKGGTVTLKLTPWGKAGSSITGINQITVSDDSTQDLDQYFGELKR